MAAVCGHRGCEWEEPWGAPRALGQLRAQVRVAPSHPTGGWNPLQKPLLSLCISGWELFRGRLEGDKPGGVEKRGNERAKAWRGNALAAGHRGGGDGVTVSAREAGLKRPQA